MNMTLDQAIKQAEKFTEGTTFHTGSEGWKAVMAVLLEEVKHERCTMCVNTVRGPGRYVEVDGVTGYIKLEDGSGVGIDESDLFLSGMNAIIELDKTIVQEAEEDTDCEVSCSGPGCCTPCKFDEVNGALPANLLADKLDHLADEIADAAKEIDIFSLAHTHHAKELDGAAKQVLQWAKDIRSESGECHG